MRKKELVIDTQFSEIDSTDIRNHEVDQSCVMHTSNSYEEKDQVIMRYMIMDLQYQGILKIEEVFDKREANAVRQAFNALKTIDQQSYLQQSSIPKLKNIQFKNNSQRKKTMISNDGKDRDYSESVDRINLLNDIADRIIETKRIKSQSKHSSHSNISQKQGKKIMTKLDNLQKMIRGIRKQNQISNQSSVVYVSRNRYPEEFITDERVRISQTIPTQQVFGMRPREYTPVRSVHPDYYYRQSQINQPQRYYYEHPQQPFHYQNYQYIEPVQSLRQFGRPSPSYHRVFRQDEAFSNRRGGFQQGFRDGPRPQFFEDENKYQESCDSESQKNRQIINDEVQQIKQQLNQLKKMNTDYIAKNTLILGEARNKQKKYAYRDQLPQRIQKNASSNIMRKSSLPKNRQNTNRQHPLVPSLDLQRNLREQQPRQIHHTYQQQFDQPRSYTDRNHHPYHIKNQEYGNYPPERMTDRGYPEQQYNTPMNIQHQQMRDPSNHICGECGCRCHDHQNPKSASFQRRGYQQG